jgi:predicted aspartyl protease
VDTGASSSVLDESVARRFSIRLTGGHEAQGAAGRQRGHDAHDVTLELPGLKVHRERMGTLDLGNISQTGGRPMELILGYELFESSVVRFDYGHGIMEVWDADHAPLPSGVTVPVTLIQNHPYVNATLYVPGRAPLKGRFVIDSGSSAALLIAPEVTSRESLLTAFPRTLVGLGRGVGGEVTHHVARADSFSLGGLVFGHPLVAMPDPSQGRITAPGAIGNIGGQLLGRCAVTFDDAHRRVFFERGPSFDRAFEGDMSGLVFARTPEGTSVRWVNPDTPASEVGLQVGDRILQVDDQPADTIDPAALRIRLQDPGRTVKLRVQRGAETMEKTLTLRRLL